MKTLLIRIISAITVVGLIFGLYFSFASQGLKFLCLSGVIISAYELSRLIFPVLENRLVRPIYYFAILATFYISAIYPHFSINVLTVCFISFSCFCIAVLSVDHTQDKILEIISRFILSLLYVGVLPSFLWRLLDLRNGDTWFAAILIIVFSGDIGAFLFGVLFGTKKLFPQISPNKSVQGSMGGLLFSMLSSLIIMQMLPHIPALSLVLLSLLTGFSGQFGDYFESLLKRIANKKDSGSIMPGHGGLLDRIDGVLFAAPIFYIAAQYLEPMFN